MIPGFLDVKSRLVQTYPLPELDVIGVSSDKMIWRNLRGYQFVDQAQVGPRKSHFRRR